MSESTDLPKVCESTLNRSGLSPDRDPLVVGVSGGCDSVTLLHLLTRLGYSGIVAHVNYGFRGLDSDGDEAFVRETAEALGWETRVARPTLSHGNRQDRARYARRGFFEDVMRESGAAAVVLAHHQDDQLETILLQIHRGGRPDILRGMDAIAGPYVRPLLDVPAAAIRAFAEADGIRWREDSSNSDLRYLRNRIRHGFLPHLDRRLVLSIAEAARDLALHLDAILNRHAEGPTLLDNLFSLPEVDLIGLAVHRFARRKGERVSEAECLKLFETTRFRPGGRIGPFVRETDGWSLVSGPVPEVRQPDGRILRRWAPGDRLDGRKVSDRMSDQKWRHWERERAMVQVGADGRIEALIRPTRNR